MTHVARTDTCMHSCTSSCCPQTGLSTSALQPAHQHTTRMLVVALSQLAGVSRQNTQNCCQCKPSPAAHNRPAWHRSCLPSALLCCFSRLINNGNCASRLWQQPGARQLPSIAPHSCPSSPAQGRAQSPKPAKGHIRRCPSCTPLCPHSVPLVREAK